MAWCRWISFALMVTVLASCAACKRDGTSIRKDRELATRSTERVAPRLDLKTFEGNWTSDPTKRTLTAKVEDGRLVFRVDSGAVFESAYDDGEERFSLALSANDGEMLVTDHYRPSPPPSAPYSADGRKACLFTFTSVDGKPLVARPTSEGGISIEFVLARVNLRGDAGTINGCDPPVVTRRLTVVVHRTK
jgi:hypothetical protein